MLLDFSAISLEEVKIKKTAYLHHVSLLLVENDSQTKICIYYYIKVYVLQCNTIPDSRHNYRTRADTNKTPTSDKTKIKTLKYYIVCLLCFVFLCMCVWRFLPLSGAFPPVFGL